MAIPLTHSLARARIMVICRQQLVTGRHPFMLQGFAGRPEKPPTCCHKPTQKTSFLCCCW